MKLGKLSASALDTEHSAQMHIVDPDSGRTLCDDDGNECYIEFMAIDSSIGRKLERDRSVAQMRKLRSGRNTDLDDDPVDVQVETLTALATGWYFGRDADEFSKTAAKTLFNDPAYAWLRKQAYTFVYTSGNFIRRSSTT